MEQVAVVVARGAAALAHGTRHGCRVAPPYRGIRRGFGAQRRSSRRSLAARTHRIWRPRAGEGGVPRRAGAAPCGSCGARPSIRPASAHQKPGIYHSGSDRAGVGHWSGHGDVLDREWRPELGLWAGEPRPHRDGELRRQGAQPGMGCFIPGLSRFSHAGEVSRWAGRLSAHCGEFERPQCASGTLLLRANVSKWIFRGAAEANAGPGLYRRGRTAGSAGGDHPCLPRLARPLCARSRDPRQNRTRRRSAARGDQCDASGAAVSGRHGFVGTTGSRCNPRAAQRSRVDAVRAPSRSHVARVGTVGIPRAGRATCRPIPRRKQGHYRRGAADCGNQRPVLHQAAVFCVVWSGWICAADCLRRRGQHAVGACRRESAGSLDSRSHRRRKSSHHSPTFVGKRGALDRGRIFGMVGGCGRTALVRSGNGLHGEALVAASLAGSKRLDLSGGDLRWHRNPVWISAGAAASQNRRERGT